MTARTPVAVATLNRSTGIVPTAYASSDNTNGNSVPNDGQTWLELSNTDTVSRNVTVTPSRTVDGQAVTGVAHTLAAAALLKIGPFPVADYGGVLQVNTTAALLKIAAYRLP